MVGLSSSKLNFIIDTNKRAPDLKAKVMSNCVLIVYHSPSFNKLPNKSLKPAFKLLLSEGLFSDVIIHVEDDEISAHKCILCTQSKIFNNIINCSESKSNQEENYAETQTGDQDSEDEELKTLDENLVQFRPMKESSKRRILDFIPSIIENISEKYRDDKIHLKITGYDISMIRNMLEWIYSGDIVLPMEMKDVIKLSQLSEEFMIDDLTSRCQEDIINHVNIDNIVDILCSNCVSNEDHSNYLLSSTVLKHCKSFFLREFQEIIIHDRDVESKICKVPGLVTMLLIHKTESKLSTKKDRKVTFSLSQNEYHLTPNDEDRYNDGMSSVSGSSYDRRDHSLNM